MAVGRTFYARNKYVGRCLRTVQCALQLDVELHQLLLHEDLRLPKTLVLLRGMQFLLLLLL